MKRLVLFSGGQDSTVCLYLAKQSSSKVKALNIYYGQKHSLECIRAQTIADIADVEYELLALTTNTLVGGSIIDKEVDVRNPHIADSWVPFRNQLFLTIAANRAVVEGYDTIVTGVNAVDYSGYPDCRPEFIESFKETCYKASEIRLRIETPLINLSKKEIVLLGAGLEGCMDALAFSHTCYRGMYPPCGECPACVLRAKGFEEAGIEDPLITGVKNA